jgi:uncharacterized membrane protein YhfC
MIYIPQILAMLPFAIMLGWLFKRLFKHWLWSAVGGAVGIFVFGLVVGSLSMFNFLSLNETTLETAWRYFLFFGWDVGVVGGAIGGVLEWISRMRQKPARAATKTDSPSANEPKR